MMAWFVREQSEMEMLFNGEAEAGARARAGVCCWVLALAKTFVGVVAGVGGSREVGREVTGDVRAPPATTRGVRQRAADARLARRRKGVEW